MTYFVTVCGGCQTVALTAVPQPPDLLPECEACQSTLRIVPSRMYREHERRLFGELSQAITQGGLSSAEADSWGRRITRALTERAYLQCWDDLSDRVPGLFSRQVMLGGNAQAHATALQLVRTILEAIALTRRSGMMPRQNDGHAPGTKTA